MEITSQIRKEVYKAIISPREAKYPISIIQMEIAEIQPYIKKVRRILAITESIIIEPTGNYSGEFCTIRITAQPQPTVKPKSKAIQLAENIYNNTEVDAHHIVDIKQAKAIHIKLKRLASQDMLLPKIFHTFRGPAAYKFTRIS